MNYWAFEFESDIFKNIFKEIFLYSLSSSKIIFEAKFQKLSKQFKKLDLNLIKSWILVSIKSGNESYLDSLEDFLISNVFDTQILSFYILNRVENNLDSKRIINKIIENSYRYFKRNELFSLLTDINHLLGYDDFRRLETIMVDHCRTDLLLDLVRKIPGFNRKIIFAALILKQKKQTWLAFNIDQFLREFPELKILLNFS